MQNDFYLPEITRIINEISLTTLRRWIQIIVNRIWCGFRLTSDRLFTLVKQADKYYFELTTLSKSYNDKRVKK